MNTSYETIIIGAGPGGLACASALARAGRKVLVIEKKKEVGPKVCAGGVTWSGFARHLPSHLMEKSFPHQFIRSNHQAAIIKSSHPIITTVNRKKLGQWMLADALSKGARVINGVKARTFSQNEISTSAGTFGYRYLVGADGSSSMVRKHLGIKTRYTGVGIHHQVPGDFERMEWHLNSRLFRSGYAWIFPHRESASIGAYAFRESMGPKALQQNFAAWTQENNIDLRDSSPRASFINFDYRGWRFDNTFLVGDAAGLASGLTGEGIYPAVISGKAVARTILTGNLENGELKTLIKKHRRHFRLLLLSSRSKMVGQLITETLILMLRSGILHFSALEMG